MNVTIDTFHQFAELLPEAMVLVTTQGVIISCNTKMAKEFLQSQHEMVVGRNLTEFVTDPPNKLLGYLRRCARNRAMLPGTFFLPHPDQEKLICRCEGALFARASGDQPTQVLLRVQLRQDASSRFLTLNQKIQQLSAEIVQRKQTEEKNHRLVQELQVALAHVKKLSSSLEKKVVYQTEGLRTVAQLSEKLNAILNVNELMSAVVNRVKHAFDYYHAHIYLVYDDALVMMEGTGPIGAELKRRNHRIALNHPKSLVAKVARQQKGVLVNDVRQSPDWMPNDLLPNTLSEIAVPIVQEGRTIGVLDVQSEQVAGIDEGDAYLLRLLANQIGVALHNARLYENLATLNEDKDKFFSIVAHDLKGPFMPVLGNAELLAEMSDLLSPDRVKEIAQSIMKSGWQVIDLLENLLQWARIQMGRMPIQPETLQLAKIAQQTVDLLHGTAEKKQITLSHTIPADLAAYADVNMIDTVIRNLTNNALKFTPDGGHVTISARKNGDFIEVSVTDSGVGMSQEVQEKLFLIGVHHTTAGTANEVGTGLGLIMCQEMVHLNSGYIWVESEEGAGSTFRFTLPPLVDTIPNADKSDGARHAD